MIQRWLTLPRLTTLFILILTGAAFQKFMRGSLNNYLIFVKPFQNLLLNKSMYGLQPHLYIDSYKYSPTFAWLMGSFYFLPLPVGVFYWNLLNAAVLAVGVLYYLSDEEDANRKRGIALLIIFQEALTTAQNMQSNNLIVGLILLGLYNLRHERVWLAALLFALCGFVKFYGVAAALFFLFYPRKVQFLVAMAVWTVVLALAPLTIIPFHSLVSEYQEWFRVAVACKLGQQVSVMGIMESWFGMPKTDANFRIIEAIGATLFLLPLLRFRLWSDPVFQRRMVAYFLVFIIIFNKMGESPTYVLAVTGVALWWLTLEQPTRLDWALLVGVILFTVLAPTDVYPKVFRKGFLIPYNIKAVGCVLVWIRLQWQLWTQLVPEGNKTDAMSVRTDPETVKVE